MSLAKMKDIGMLSSDKTPVFDHIAEMARSLLECKVGLISLMDGPNDRQFFKAGTGLAQPWSEQRHPPLTQSFGKTVVARGAPLVIADARLYTRFKCSSAIDHLGVVAYLGVPLNDESGRPFAALCVIDTEPREWTSDEIDILNALGERVSVLVKLMLARHNIKFAETGAKKATIGDVVLDNLSGPLFSHYQGSDGREAIKITSPGCDVIWKIVRENFKNRFSNIFAMCLWEELTHARVSLENPSRLSHWKQEWNIITPSGAVNKSGGYGLPEKLPGGGMRLNVVV